MDYTQQYGLFHTILSGNCSDVISQVLTYATIAILMVLTFAGIVISNILVRPSFYLGSKKSYKKLADELPDFDAGAWKIDSKRNGLGNPKTDLDLEYEDVEFPLGPIAMHGNTTLRGWFIPAQTLKYKPKKRRLSLKRKYKVKKASHGQNGENEVKQHVLPDRQLCVVVCHGGGRDRRQHLRHVPVLIQYGASVLLFDKQEHGLSDGQERGIGWFSYEGSDMYAACKYAKWTLNFKKVVAMGTSFGAAGALTAAGHFDAIKAGEQLSEKSQQIIDAVVAENPPYGRFRFVRDSMHMHVKILPAFARDILATAVYLSLCVRRGSLTLPDPSETIKNIAPRPLLITHGKTDSIVPFEHGLELYKLAMEPKDCLWVPDCKHTLVFNRDPKGWEEKVSALLKKVVCDVD